MNPSHDVPVLIAGAGPTGSDRRPRAVTARHRRPHRRPRTRTLPHVAGAGHPGPHRRAVTGPRRWRRAGGAGQPSESDHALLGRPEARCHRITPHAKRIQLRAAARPVGHRTASHRTAQPAGRQDRTRGRADRADPATRRRLCSAAQRCRRRGSPRRVLSDRRRRLAQRDPQGARAAVHGQVADSQLRPWRPTHRWGCAGRSAVDLLGPQWFSRRLPDG
jgi:hypothetical protein